MAIIKFTKLNGDLLRNLPDDIKEELIYFEEVIPDGIMSSLCANDPFYDKERMDFLDHRPDLLEKMYYARGRREELVETNQSGLSPVSVRINVETDEAVQFIKDYPKFKQLIEGIKFYDNQEKEYIKFVPIDEYLNEN